MVIKYAPDALKKNIGYIHTAVKNNYKAFQYIPAELQNVNIITLTLSYHMGFLNILDKSNNIKNLYNYYYYCILNQISLKTFMRALLKKTRRYNIIRKLNLGHNFNYYLYKQIIEYLKIPTGEDFKFLSRAYYNLTHGISCKRLEELRCNEKCHINIKMI
jgi:hypothetical protein